MDDVTSRYELLDLVGKGGMAEVCRARMLGAAGFEKIVAVKRILADHSGDQEFVQRFVDEAKLTVRLVHPNICQILDFGVMDGRHFIAMEYVDGLDLSAVLKGLDRDHDRMPIDVVLYVTSCVLRGLKSAHEARDERGNPLGIVHRDVSPHNVLLSVNGDVKLSDLGAATANPAHRAARTRKHFRLGKVLYMAPEQRRVGPLDARADIYSTGVLLTEMLLGVTRFHKVANMFLARLCTLADQVLEIQGSEVGRQMAAVVERATAEEPGGRYQSASEMLGVVEALLVDLAAGISVDRVARLVTRLQRRNEGSASGAASVSLSGPVEAVSYRTAGLDDDDEESSAETPLTIERMPRPRPASEPVEIEVVSFAEPPRVVPLDVEPEEDLLDLDNATTAVMGRPAAAEAEVDDQEPDTLRRMDPRDIADARSWDPPVASPLPVEMPPAATLDRGRARREPSRRQGATPVPVASPRRRHAAPGLIVGLVLGTALLVGLGIGALVATGALGGGARHPSLPGSAIPSEALDGSVTARDAEPDGARAPRPVARIALEVGTRRDGDGGGAAPAPTFSGDGAPVPGQDEEPGASHARRGFGYLNINSRPYGVPYVDGDQVGPETPVARLKLPAGQHRVKVFFPQVKRHVVRTVRIRADETHGVVIRLEDE